MAPNIRLRVLPQILPNDGRDVEIRNNGTFIQWRYSSDHLGDYEWQNIIAISALIGPAGPAIELRTDGTYIQYRIVGGGEDGWVDVIPLADLKGDQGDQGPAATVAIGAVTTLAPGSAATVVNTGTANDAVFDFGLPSGANAIYATVAGLPAFTIPADMPLIRINGASASDDPVGGGKYAFRETEPVASAKVQDQAGKWFERVSADLPINAYYSNAILSLPSYYQDTGLFPAAGESHLTLGIGIGAVDIAIREGFNRSVVFVSGGPRLAKDVDRAEFIGNQVGQYSEYLERSTLIGANSGQFLGISFQPNYLLDGLTPHPYWREKLISAGFAPGEVGWDFNGMETRNPGIGARIAAYTAYAQASGDHGRSVAIGRNSANTTIKMWNSVFIGYDAGGGYDVSGLVGIGEKAFNQSAFLIDSVAIGQSAGRYLQIGQLYTLIGPYAGQDLVGNNDSYGTAVLLGSYSGSGLSLARSSVLIGHRSGQRTGVTSREQHLWIGSAEFESRRPLIGGHFVNGTFGINCDPNDLHASHPLQVYSTTGTLMHYVTSGGTMYNLANILVGKTSASTSAVGAGWSFSSGGSANSFMDGTGANTHISFRNNAAVTPASVGSISTSGTATAYNTSSDEVLKDFRGVYDPAEAIRIIRADPVRAFDWKSNGQSAIGWGAQTSYEIANDLATPGYGAPGDEDYQPWGIDQGKRTPYLWAATSYLIDKAEDFEKRLSALEAA